MKVRDAFSFGTLVRKNPRSDDLFKVNHQDRFQFGNVFSKSTIRPPEQRRNGVFFLVKLRAYVFDFKWGCLQNAVLVT